MGTIPGLSYVGADYTEDSNVNDIVNKSDADSEFGSATVSQSSVIGQINTATSTLASSTYVNTALEAYVQTNFLNLSNVYTLAVITEGSSTTGTYTLSFGAQTTAPIAYNATALVIQEALDTLSNLLNVIVAGGIGGPYEITLTVQTAGLLSANDTLLINGSVEINPSSLIPADWSGNFVAPLVSGSIPSKYIPSLGVGYVRGPYGATSVYAANATGSVPVKIADWNIGPVGISHQPQVYMSVEVSGVNGARPAIDVAIGSGEQPYSAQTLIARGVGRNCWNDSQALTVLSAPSILGHTGLANSGYSPTYNVWISAWLYGVNGQSVTVASGNIANAGVWFWRYQS